VTEAAEQAALVGKLDDEELQQLLAAVVRSYAARIIDEPGDALAPFPPDSGVTATDAILAAGEILRAMEISSFELATILNL
jgi:hypothetical protein